MTNNTPSERGSTSARREPGADIVDAASAEWARECPRLDVSPGEILARIQRLAQLIEDAQNQRLQYESELRTGNLGDFDVLRALRRSGPPYALTSAQLHRSMLVSAAGLSGRLKRLESHGWITRTPSSEDRRSTRVQLTDRALSVLNSDLAAHYEFEATLLKALSPRERTSLTTILRRLLLDIESR